MLVRASLLAIKVADKSRKKLHMRRYSWLVGASLVALSVAGALPASAQNFPAKGTTPFDWSQSYIAGSLGAAHFGEMARTEVDDKFGILGTKSQVGLMTSLEYGRLIDAHHDVRLALRSAYMPEHIIDAAGSSGLAYGKTNLAYETLDAEVGRRIRLSDPTTLRLFAGLRAIHSRDQIEEIALGAFSSGQKATAETWAAGPRAGIEFAHRLGAQPVFLTGGVDAAVLFGRTQQNLLINTFGGDPPFVNFSSSNNATLYTLGGRLAMTWLASPATSFTLGYQAEYIWNLRQAYSDVLVFPGSDLGGIDNRGHNLVHGPFAKVAVALDAVGKPTAAAMPAVWTGFHVGAHGGGGFTVADAANAALATASDTYVFSGGGNLEGAVAGVHAGYDWQWGALLAGIEADASWSGMTGTGKIMTGLAVTFDATWLASVRGRLGWAHENALFYLTGGVAWASAKGQLVSAGMLGASATHGYQGYVAGGGIEYRFAPQWSARAEYLHYELGIRHYALATADGSYSSDMNLSADVIRMGLTRSFNFGR
jgi:outer membrane immunogenic protein